MNLQNKAQKSNVQTLPKENKKALINLESNAKIINNLIEKQQEIQTEPQDKQTVQANTSSILNSKDIEIFNNIANKLAFNNTPLTSTQKKRKIISKNASCENIKNLIDNKNKEIEIFNKINNFSLKYSNAQPHNNSLLNSSALTKRTTARTKSQNNSVSKSNSKNVTPNKKKNFLITNSINNNNSLYKTNVNVNFYNNNNNNNNLSNTSFNNSQLLHGINNTNTNYINSNYNLKQKDESSFFVKENSEILSKLNNNGLNAYEYSGVKHKKYDHSHPHKISKIIPISPQDFENCVISDEDDHLPQAPSDAAKEQLSRSIVFKPKPPLELINYQSQECINIPVIEEESFVNNLEEEYKPAAYSTAVKNTFYESKKNIGISGVNNSIGNNNNNNDLGEFANAEKNNKELLKALTHMEQEINRSEFNNAMHSKSHISINADVAKHFENYDLTHLNYDLVKEYSNLKIDKDEEFMKRMLFDIFKRQTKDERLEKIIEKNKVKMDENDRIRAFNRLIEDANRRLEAQENIEELKVKLNKGVEDEKNYTTKDWEDIYQQRFINYQSYRDNWVRERQSEKERIEKEKELEIIKSCKTIKKPKKNVEEFCNRMYEEAKRRQIKLQKKKENYDNEEKDVLASANNFDNNGLNKNIKNIKNDKKNDKSIQTILDNKNNRKSVEKNAKQATNYNFQSDFNSNQISENETNKQFNKFATFREQSRKSLNFSSDLIRELNESPIKKRSKSKENLNKETTPMKIRRESDNKLSNSEMNNLRFECDPNESKKNLLRNSSSLLSVSQENKQKDMGVYEFVVHKSPNKVVDFSANLFSANIKNMHDIQNNNFDISDEEIISDIPKPYKIRAKKPSYKIVPVMFSNTQMKFLPDHVAINVVDNILNPKIYDD